MTAQNTTTASTTAAAAAAPQITMVEKAKGFWSTYGVPTAKIGAAVAVGAAAGFYLHKYQAGKSSEGAPKLLA